MTEGPIRLTKKRAAAMLECFERGRESELESLHQTFGVTVSKTGEISIEDADFALLDSDQANELTNRVEALTDALAASVIFMNRYVK